MDDVVAYGTPPGKKWLEQQRGVATTPPWKSKAYKKRITDDLLQESIRARFIRNDMREMYEVAYEEPAPTTPPTPIPGILFAWEPDFVGNKALAWAALQRGVFTTKLTATAPGKLFSKYEALK